jgi:hypothetical protein
MANRFNPDKAAVFIEQLSTGAGLSDKSPVLVLRKRLSDAAASTSKLLGDVKLGFMLRTWINFRDGRQVSILRPSPSDLLIRFEPGAEG